MKSFQQVDSGRWPSGRGKAIAIIGAYPEGIQSRFGVMFRGGRDDLDSLQHAGIKLASGRSFLLMRYAGDGPGTSIEIDSTDDSIQAFREFVETFDLDDSDFLLTPCMLAPEDL